MQYLSELTNPEALERDKALHDELGLLSKQQSEALHKAIFLTFTRDQAMEYDRRAERIGEICRLLSASNLKR
jgi:hypothetical protein